MKSWRSCSLPELESAAPELESGANQKLPGASERIPEVEAEEGVPAAAAAERRLERCPCCAQPTLVRVGISQSCMVTSGAHEQLCGICGWADLDSRVTHNRTSDNNAPAANEPAVLGAYEGGVSLGTARVDFRARATRARQGLPPVRGVRSVCI